MSLTNVITPSRSGFVNADQQMLVGGCVAIQMTQCARSVDYSNERMPERELDPKAEKPVVAPLLKS